MVELGHSRIQGVADAFGGHQGVKHMVWRAFENCTHGTVGIGYWVSIFNEHMSSGTWHDLWKPVMLASKTACIIISMM